MPDNSAVQPAPDPSQTPDAAPQAPTSSNGGIGTVPGSVQPVNQAQSAPPTNAQTIAQVAANQGATQQPPSQVDLHTSAFHKILSRMNQGDQQVQRDRNGQPVMGADGKPVTQPMSSKQMGRSILSSVLASLAATEAHQPYRNGNGQWVNPSNEAVAAGQQAFQAGRPKAQYDAANEQLQKTRSQQYATYENNIKMLAQTQQLYQLKGKQMTDAVDHYKDMTDALTAGGITNPETGESLYDPNYASMTPQEMEAHLKAGDITRLNAWPSSVEPIIGADGQPTGKSQLRWAAIKEPANINLTQAMIDKHPELKGAPVGNIPLLQYFKLARTGADNSSLESMIQNVSDTQQEAFPSKDGKPAQFSFNQFKKDAHLTADQAHQMHALAGMPPDQFMGKVRAMDDANGGGGHIAEALGKQGITISEPDWKDKRAGDLASDKKGVGAQAASKERVAALRGLAEGVGLKPEQANLALSELPTDHDPTNDEVTKATENIRSQAKTNSDAASKLTQQQSLALDKSYQFNSTQLEKIGKPIDDAVARFGRLQDTINQTTPQADALVAPELLTVMAGGAGSGLRMNEAEISRIVGGRSNYESLKAAANKWQLDPSKALSITPSQRQQIKSLMSVVYSKLQAKQGALDEARQGLISAGSEAAHRQVVAGVKKNLDGIDAQTNFGGKVTVKLPDGTTASFPNQAAADHFKKLSGVQ